MKRPTQREKIRQLLQNQEDCWVPCYLLAAISLQYNARVYELRAQGFEILNSTQKRTDGTVYSWFKHPAPKGQMSFLEQLESVPGGPS